MEPSKVARKKIDSKVKLEVNWQYVKEPSISFRSLMMRLLEPRSNQAETKNGEKDAKEQHCPGGG